jgi:glycosyltransferase involved in cell wall biosynthesis
LNREIPVVRTPLDIPLNEFLDTSFYNQFLKNKKYILFFGTLSKIKGPDLIAEIIPRVLKENPDLFFVFIGRDDGLYGGERMTDYIKNRVKPFDENVFCHPAISKSKLYAVIAHAHGVVLPSRVDNYPNACLEAQYFGKPVIGSRDSSLEEMIIDGKTGFLARNGDIEDLYSCITRLLNLSDTEYNKMSTDIQKQIKTMLNEDRVGQLLHFYENVIKNYRKDKKDPT